MGSFKKASLQWYNVADNAKINPWNVGREPEKGREQQKEDSPVVFLANVEPKGEPRHVFGEKTKDNPSFP